MRILDVVVPGCDAQPVRCGKHIGYTIAFGRYELITGQFKQLPVGVSEVNRVHKASINVARVPDAAFIQPPSRLRIGSARNVKSQVMEIADPFWIGRCIIYSRRTNEEGNQ